VLISRDFVRAVLSRVIDRQWTVTEGHGKYRPTLGATALLPTTAHPCILPSVVPHSSGGSGEEKNTG
jgi:hypothetical protein